MFQKTDNPYSFKYLITGITGPGIEQVYLPLVPSEDKILFKKENKFVLEELPEHLRKADREKNSGKPISKQHEKEITEWEDKEWERSENGIFFWNNGIITYITGFYYWVL